MESKQETLEQKAEKYYHFKLADFVPLSGFSRYNRRVMYEYSDECRKAERVITPAFAKIAPRRLLLMMYNFFIVWGSLEAVSWMYDKL